MNPDVKSKWITALRSGNYKQGKAALRTQDRYCCLGVLTDLYFKATGAGKWEPKNDNGEMKAVLTEKDSARQISHGEWTYLMPSVAKWAGIAQEGAYYACSLPTEIDNIHRGENHMGTEKIGNLASANDNNYTFEEIADIIEEQL